MGLDEINAEFAAEVQAAYEQFRQTGRCAELAESVRVALSEREDAAEPRSKWGPGGFNPIEMPAWPE